MADASSALTWVQLSSVSSLLPGLRLTLAETLTAQPCPSSRPPPRALVGLGGLLYPVPARPSLERCFQTQTKLCPL